MKKFDLDEKKRHAVLSKYFSLISPSNNIFSLFSDEELSWIASSLLRKEEFELDHRDEWGNWDFNFTHENYKVPYVDELIVQRISESGLRKRNLWPNDKSFAFWLTHDLDVVSSEDPVVLNRLQNKLASNASGKNKRLIHKSFATYNKLRSWKSFDEDPLWAYERWIDLEKEAGFDSTFFVFSRPSLMKDLHQYDCDFIFEDRMKYRGKNCTVADFIEQLSMEGFEIGLHGSYLSWDNSTMLLDQKVSIEKIIKKLIVALRQHFLHFDIGKTPDALINAGIKVDSTLGFNRSVGFRAGTSFPYSLVDGLIEVPQIIMDGALFNHNSLNYNEKLAFLEVERILDKVEKVGGCITINFHPNYLLIPSYWNTYKFIIKELTSRNAACMNAERIIKVFNED
ncbi:MAG: polysaccharide deacetylase family protein [Bacteroidetes bacterium]|nr:polysaccharide deacetylase family protein [Bacteroidota bacterium]